MANGISKSLTNLSVCRNIKSLRSFCDVRDRTIDEIKKEEYMYGKRAYNDKMSLLVRNHLVLERKLRKIRRLPQLALNSIGDDTFSKLVSNDIFLHTHEPRESVMSCLFDTWYSKSLITTIDMFLEDIDDEDVEKEIIKEKWRLLSENAELERWYLELDSLRQADELDIGNLSDENARLHIRCEEGLFNKKKKSYFNRCLDEELKRKESEGKPYKQGLCAIRLVALFPFVEEQDISVIYGTTRETLKKISYAAYKKVRERIVKPVPIN